MPCCEVVNPDTGDLLVRLEYFQEHDPRNPTVFDQFIERHAFVRQEILQKTYKTVVYDSATSLEMLARVQSKNLLNKKIEDQRKHYGYSTNELGEILCMAVGGLPCNIVVVCHIDSDKDEVLGTFVRNPSFPGKLKTMIGKDYSEFYYLRAGYTPETQTYFNEVQTRTRNGMHAASQIHAPDPCASTYEALWQNWTSPRRPIHCLVYGDPGAGKSTFVATFPTPILVFMFDGLGKDTPYLNLGLSSDIVD